MKEGRVKRDGEKDGKGCGIEKEWIDMREYEREIR